MKILPKLTLTFLAVSLVPFSVGSAIAHYNVERALEREALRHLSALAAIKHSQLTRLGQEHLDQVSNVPSYGVAAALLADPAFSADLDQVVRGYAGLGRTGEACVAARSPEGGALFLHALRFDSRAALRRTLKASESQIPMNRALRREELAIPDAVDYRGVPVLAATRYVEGLGWGLVVKIDKAEALQTLYTLRAFLLALFLAIAGLAVAASVTISRRITTPIARLTAAASAIRLGEQGVRLNLPEKDEIGVLARTIERMADSPIEANSDFERKVSERTAELAATNAELEQFAYVASHDLQEPLRIVTSYVRLLQRRYRGQLDSDADEFIEFAADAATRMRQLIEDLLAYSRVERPGPSLEGVDLGELTREAIRNLKAAIDETEACVLVGELPVVPCRRSQLLQVLQNLISNALKYRAGHAPQVRVEAVRKGASWEIVVSDDGIGGFYTRTGVGTSIAHGRETRTICGREYLFEAPLQADVALIRAHRGDALGNLTHRKTARNGNPVMATAADLVVAEVEHLVELGDIDADAVHTPGIYVDRIVQGMRYERRIEYRTVRPRGSRPRATKEANGMPKSGFNRNELVLIADPHYDRLIARLSLESEGYDVEVVNSLAAARRRAGEALPAVVVLDCEDCCLEGQALMRDLKCDPRTADIAVVALTACRGLDGACLALSAGCDRVMHKNQAVDLPRHMELLLRGPLG